LATNEEEEPRMHGVDTVRTVERFESRERWRSKIGYGQTSNSPRWTGSASYCLGSPTTFAHR
jgi:hypothetical protein